MKDNFRFDQYQAIDELILSNLREFDDLDDETNFVDVLIQIYRQEAPVAFQGLQEAFSNADQRGIIHWSHKLKGLSRNLGVRRLSEVCNTIEHEAGSLHMSELRRLIGLVEAELDEAFRLLHEHMTDKAA